MPPLTLFRLLRCRCGLNPFHFLQPTFSEFTKDQHPNSRIRNFCLLEPILRGLNIKFNANIASDIMTERKNAAIGLVYEIKITVSKLTSRQAAIVGRDRPGGRASSAVQLVHFLRECA